LRRWALSALTGMMVAGLLSGCGRFSREMYDTIFHGQLQSEVRSKLGRPDRTVDNAWIYVRRRPFGSAAILFENGEVCGKIWSDTKPIDLEAIERYRRGKSDKQ